MTLTSKFPEVLQAMQNTPFLCPLCITGNLFLQQSQKPCVTNCRTTSSSPITQLYQKNPEHQLALASTMPELSTNIKLIFIYIYPRP